MADDERDPQLARWLEVEPLDDVTRRRLVTRALGESEAHASPATRSGAWRWLAVAAVVVVVLVVGLSLLASNGGHDDQQASTREKSHATALTPESFDQALSTAPDVGDYGNLDVPANRAALRQALEQPARTRAPAAASPYAGDAAGTSAQSTPSTPSTPPGCARGSIGTIVARARGTLDGRPVTVVLLQGSTGAHSIEALFDDACEGRHLEGPSR